MNSNILKPQTQAYFDCNATSPVSPHVLQNLSEWAVEWGNPSSIHWAGRKPKTLLREARSHIAKALGVSPLELVFTSGGTESNNTIIKMTFESSPNKHFITSRVEHPSVLKTMHALLGRGAQVDFVPVSKNGFIDLDFYKEKLTAKTSLVSIMTANNETGNIFPIKEMAKIAQQRQVPFHTDAVQALGKINMDLRDWDVSAASLSAHKFYALKGTGLLYIKKGVSFEPLLSGGGQERSRRGGTENVLGIAAFGKMAEFLNLTSQKEKEIKELRDHLESRILSEIPEVTVTGLKAPRLPNTSSLVIAGVDGETLLMSLDLKGYAVSTGAACSSGSPEPSPVLLAMGLTRQEAQSSLRLSLGWFHTLIDVNHFVDTLKEVVIRLRNIREQKYSDAEVPHV